jgi:hypothetical protein
MNFNILYYGVFNPQPISIDAGALTGGTNNNRVSASISSLRDYNGERQYFNAIPYDFLRMAAPRPTVVVTYGSIPAICVDCFYQYQTTSPISVTAAAFKTGNTGLDITLRADAANTLTSVLVSDITVTLYGQPCVLDAGSTTTRLLCTFNTASCGGNIIPSIPAGN